jgi:hypothetical protein
VTRLLITRTDSGGRTFNFSEIVGNGAGTAISNAYYPSGEHRWTKTGQKWVTQITLDGVFNIVKEFLARHQPRCRDSTEGGVQWRGGSAKHLATLLLSFN